ncbi:MAG: 2-oxoacid:acceptor oxidoreductase family protein [Thermodesulfobacteriota bacterium]|nr:2-oxoacid:acceptor oxidoreductase family protein [Thermodesulfobacteriota bacterium]
MYHEIIMSGVGGQGIMVIGSLLAQAAFMENLNVTYTPIYGVEKRGGHADCTVVISSEEIGSPIVDSPQSCIIMSRPSLGKYGPRVKPGGFLLLNSSFVDPLEVRRKDLDILSVPALEIAQTLGNDRLSNMVIIGAFVEKTRVVSLDTLAAALSQIFEEHYHHLLPANAAAISKGAEYARNSFHQ